MYICTYIHIYTYIYIYAYICNTYSIIYLYIIFNFNHLSLNYEEAENQDKKELQAKSEDQAAVINALSLVYLSPQNFPEYIDSAFKRDVSTLAKEEKNWVISIGTIKVRPSSAHNKTSIKCLLN